MSRTKENSEPVNRQPKQVVTDKPRNPLAERQLGDNNLTDRTNSLNNTLSACEELLEALRGRVEGLNREEDKDECGRENSLCGSIGRAEIRADNILKNLRELASTIGA